MSHIYQAVQWNRQKKRYDLAIAAGVILYLAVFVGAGATLFPNATAETLLIRGLSTAAFLLLHIILSIGPLCRLNTNFLPLLYNRRHLGVTMFILALAHSILATIQFHAFGNINPLASILSSGADYSSISSLPFQPLGLAALAIFFLMAATSHDFWLANLSAPVWKALHMMVYVAYALVVAHVALGIMQVETVPIMAILTSIGFIWLIVLHLMAGNREKSIDQQSYEAERDGFISVCNVNEIPENRAKIANIGGERIAIFKYEGKLSAISNVCQHQNGPLGEGKIVDGFVTCPWHGFQYRPNDGASPAPFTEKVPTFNLKLVDGRIYVNPNPNIPGTAVEPVKIETEV